MEFAGTFIREIFTIAGYAMVFAAVYKIFQIATDLGEIRDLLKRGHPLTQATQAMPDSVGEEAYAERLLQSVRADPASSENSPRGA